MFFFVIMGPYRDILLTFLLVGGSDVNDEQSSGQRKIRTKWYHEKQQPIDR